MKQRMKAWMDMTVKVVSVFALLIRSSFYKVLGVLTAVAICEVLAFEYVLYGSSHHSVEAVPAPEALVDEAYIRFFFLAALGLIMIILAWTEMRMSEKSGYTMMRLRLSRRQIFAVKAVYNGACLTLLFVLQIWLGIWMVYRYGELMQLKLPAPQLLFMSFYRNEFLHCVLPMQEIGKWIRNILILTALSMEAAGVIIFPGEKRKNKLVIVNCLCIVTLAWFISPPGKNLRDMCCDLLFVSCIAAELLKVYGVFGRLEAEQEDEAMS